MSSVGAFAAYGPLGGFSFPTQSGPKNRVASSGSEETRPGAGPQRSDGSQNTVGDIPQSSAEESVSQSFRPVTAPDAAEKDRFEATVLGTDPEEETSNILGTKEEQSSEPDFDPVKSVENLAQRIEDQVQRFEEFLARLNEYAKLRDAKKEEAGQADTDLFGRVQEPALEAEFRVSEYLVRRPSSSEAASPAALLGDLESESPPALNVVA